MDSSKGLSTQDCINGRLDMRGLLKGSFVQVHASSAHREGLCAHFISNLPLDCAYEIRCFFLLCLSLLLLFGF